MQNQKITISSKNQKGGITAQTVNSQDISTKVSLSEKKTPLKNIEVIIGIIAGIVTILTYFGIKLFIIN